MNSTTSSTTRGRGILAHTAPLTKRDRICFTCHLPDCDTESSRCPVRIDKHAETMRLRRERQAAAQPICASAGGAQ